MMDVGICRDIIKCVAENLEFEKKKALSFHIIAR